MCLQVFVFCSSHDANDLDSDSKEVTLQKKILNDPKKT
jgi:hypothetical protein